MAGRTAGPAKSCDLRVRRTSGRHRPEQVPNPGHCRATPRHAHLRRHECSLRPSIGGPAVRCRGGPVRVLPERGNADDRARMCSPGHGRDDGGEFQHSSSARVAGSRRAAHARQEVRVRRSHLRRGTRRCHPGRMRPPRHARHRAGAVRSQRRSPPGDRAASPSLRGRPSQQPRLSSRCPSCAPATEGCA